MKVVRRPLAPGETDLELLFAPILAACMAGGFLLLRGGHSFPECPFAGFTGHPCLSCGTTRAMHALLQGHLFEAFTWNPLALLVFILIVFWMVYAFAVAGRRTLRLRLIGFTFTSRVTLIGVVILNWGYLFFRHD